MLPEPGRGNSLTLPLGSVPALPFFRVIPVWFPFYAFSDTAKKKNAGGKMKNFIIVLFIILSIPSICFAEKTYLFEDFYYGMSRKEIEKSEKLTKVENQAFYYTERYFYIGDYSFGIYLNFDKNQNLKDISLFKDISNIPEKYSQINMEEYLNYKVMEYINSFATRFFYVMNDMYYTSIKNNDFIKAIKRKNYFYYALGKDTYRNIKNKSDGTMSNFYKLIQKNNRIIEVSLIGDYLSINFKLFKDVYKDGEPLYIGVKRMNQSLQ